MQIRRLIADDDGVSPVIGVILMVAITVILAAVIGAFVLGFGNGGSAAPTASFETTEVLNSTDNGTYAVDFTIEQSGDTIQGDNLQFGGSAADGWNDSSAPSAELGASDTVTIDIGTNASAGETVSLVWDDGDSSSTLAEHELDNPRAD